MRRKAGINDGIHVLEDFVCQAVVEQRGLSDNCIYTVAHPDRLLGAANSKPTHFKENRPWVTGLEMWKLAQKKDLDVPVIFGDSTDCGRLLYWGLLRDIQLVGKTTTYHVGDLRKINGAHSPQELVLRSTGGHISGQHIRPYAICETPFFIKKA